MAIRALGGTCLRCNDTLVDRAEKEVFEGGSYRPAR
ncbi:hypothetical protein SALBM311S_12397 [Streptomyces alboniger]